MSNECIKTDQAVTVEFVVRQIVNGQYPGKILSGPFADEAEAKEQQHRYVGAGVFKECWFN